MPVPAVVEQLVEKFAKGIDLYKSPTYNETQVRIEFVNPLFEALGWPIADSRVVAHEAKVLVDGKPKRPDYEFKISGSPRFFVETKKPSVNLRDNPEPAYQVRRYGWSATLPVSHLTDFEEFNLYDCRIRPDQKDPAHKSRLRYFNYQQYIECWDDIESILSYDAVRDGSLETLVEETKTRGVLPVDTAFLQEIEYWRELLAKDISLHHPELTHRELNHAVQMTIDRIVFLRICEDRGIEPYANLKRFGTRENSYSELKRLFQQADGKYNSGLFHFAYDADREGEPDGLSLNLHISDEPLNTIIQNLYYPNSPYEFSVVEAHILGHVYERFLGKVIELSSGGQVEVVEKPEVRKAGGVFYTPRYIVDKIVQQTLDPLVKGKTAAEVDRLKILDPACGSGSFLLGAYEYLMNWYLEYYQQHNLKSALKAGLLWEIAIEGMPSQYRLTVLEKRRILCNNLYGVDLDQQAVEVTKLSLLLRMLEHENAETVQPKLMDGPILPDLITNIKWGNALIGTEFYQDKQLSLFEQEDFYRFRVFDWHDRIDGFGEIMKAGGFDAAIGNPPYVRIQVMQETAPESVIYYKQKYQAAQKGNYDLYVTFVERALELLNKSGRMGYILPHKFFNAQYGEPLRKLIADGKHLAEVVHFGDQQVFAGATTYTCLLILSKAAQDAFCFSRVDDLQSWRYTGESIDGSLPISHASEKVWNFTVGEFSPIQQKLDKMAVKLGDIAHLFVGLQTDADDVFILKEVRQDKDRVLCYSAATQKEHWFENSHLQSLLKGSVNIRRYKFSDVDKRLIFPYINLDGKSELIAMADYASQYPLTWAYLEENKARLTKRNKGNLGDKWYGYVYKKNHVRFSSPKLLVPSIATGSCFAPDLHGQYYFVGSGGGGGGGYGITLTDPKAADYYYLLGLLNSKLLSAFLKENSTPFRGGYIALNRQYIEQIPIRLIDADIPQEKALHDEMSTLVKRMLDLQDQISSASGQASKILKALAATIDRDIDALVYQLYKLTPDEIAIIEALN